MLISSPKKKKLIIILIIILHRFEKLMENSDPGGISETMADQLAKVNCKVAQTAEANWTTAQTNVWNATEAIYNYFAGLGMTSLDTIDAHIGDVDWDIMTTDYSPDLQTALNAL